MEMRIPTDKDCFNNFIIQNWKSFGDSVNNGIQKDVMCSFRKRTDVKQKTEDPKAQFISGLSQAVFGRDLTIILIKYQYTCQVSVY